MGEYGRVARKVAAAPKATDHTQRINELKRQIDNLTEAVATGALRASPALAGRLEGAEAELSRLTTQTTKPVARIVDFAARLTMQFNKAIEKLEGYVARDPHRARAALRHVCGEIPVFPHESGKFLVAKLGLSETFLRAAVGSE
jgi:hypothetical protein